MGGVTWHSNWQLTPPPAVGFTVMLQVSAMLAARAAKQTRTAN
jgi:hypothetical protein